MWMMLPKKQKSDTVPNIRAYIHGLHERKVYILTTRGLPTILGYGAEVSRGHSRLMERAIIKDRGLTSTEGLNVRIRQSRIVDLLRSVNS